VTYASEECDKRRILHDEITFGATMEGRSCAVERKREEKEKGLRPWLRSGCQLCEGVSSVDACTVAAPDAIAALAVPNPGCSALSLSFEQTVLANPVAKLRIVCGSMHFNVGAIVHPIVLGKPNH
jgi:hypothetical protein